MVPLADCSSQLPEAADGNTPVLGDSLAEIKFTSSAGRPLTVRIYWFSSIPGIHCAAIPLVILEHFLPTQKKPCVHQQPLPSSSQPPETTGLPVCRDVPNLDIAQKGKTFHFGHISVALGEDRGNGPSLLPPKDSLGT